MTEHCSWPKFLFAAVAIGAISFFAGVYFQGHRECNYSAVSTPIGIARLDTKTGEILFATAAGKELGRIGGAFDPDPYLGIGAPEK